MDHIYGTTTIIANFTANLGTPVAPAMPPASTKFSTALSVPSTIANNGDLLMQPTSDQTMWIDVTLAKYPMVTLTNGQSAYYTAYGPIMPQATVAPVPQPAPMAVSQTVTQPTAMPVTQPVAMPSAMSVTQPVVMPVPQPVAMAVPPPASQSMPTKSNGINLNISPALLVFIAICLVLLIVALIALSVHRSKVTPLVAAPMTYAYPVPTTTTTTTPP